MRKVAAAVALFLLPAGDKQGERTMNWETAKKLPWDILVLFGGGMSLAAAVQSTGVAEFLGSQAARFAGMPDFVVILVVAGGILLASSEAFRELGAGILASAGLAGLAVGQGILAGFSILFCAMILDRIVQGDRK